MATTKKIGSNKNAAPFKPKLQFNSKYGKPSGQGNNE